MEISPPLACLASGQLENHGFGDNRAACCGFDGKGIGVLCPTNDIVDSKLLDASDGFVEQPGGFAVGFEGDGFFRGPEDDGVDDVALGFRELAIVGDSGFRAGFVGILGGFIPNSEVDGIVRWNSTADLRTTTSPSTDKFRASPLRLHRSAGWCG